MLPMSTTLQSRCLVGQFPEYDLHQQQKREVIGGQAGAELCEAQFKLGLAKPAVASQVLASLVR